ncbi:hypothetical protein JW851_01745, partial [Candidatus Woesearchaeota archaeon]|nr:hypothetical protein [Candidatus Woesearchaeota archaeon]
MEFQFFPLDITYKIEEDKPVIYLFGKTLDNQRICVVDDSFRPYFWVVPKKGADLKMRIKPLFVERNNERYDVLSVEEVKKKFNEKEVLALKVSVNFPKGVPAIKEILNDWDDIESVNEYDILFTRRYLVDKKITPLTTVKVIGEPFAKKLKIPAIKLESIEQLNDDAVKEPKVIAFDIETYNQPGKVPDQNKDPIIMLALYGKDFKKVITWKKFRTDEDYVEFVSSEADLLERFKELIDEHKPDFVAGYFSDGFDLPFIAARAKKYKIKLDIALDYSELKISGRNIVTAEIRGIPHIDILKFIKRVVSKSLETDIFTLDAVANEILGEKKLDVDMNEFSSAWDSAHDSLNEYSKYNLHDAYLAYKLFGNLWPNMVELVKVVGLPVYDVIRMSFSQLVEWYILKKARELNVISPNKPSFSEKKARMVKRVKGALVLEPSPGLYNNLVICDYRSLYPTVIASHNISPGTLNCSCCEGAKPVPFESKSLWFCQKKKGLIASVIEELITRRARIKEMLKKGFDPLLYARSWALKDMANSMYGYLGFEMARWYCHECAEATTAYARYYIKKVISDAEQSGFKVLYGDTDSVFLLLNEKTVDNAKKFVEKVNLDLPGLMELEFEGFFPSGLFVAAKKRYALIDDKGNIKIVGFETVRRNCSPIAKDVQKMVFKIILGENDIQKAAEYVRNIVRDVKEHKVPLDKMIIHTVMSKDIDDYETIGPHVAAAQIMKSKGIDVGPGSRIQFVITKGKGLIRDKVKLPANISNEDYDSDYYISNQILPGVERVFTALGFSMEDLSEETSQSTLGSFY